MKIPFAVKLLLDYSQALDRIGQLAGGDPRRPDWDPLDATGLVEMLVRGAKDEQHDAVKP